MFFLLRTGTIDSLHYRKNAIARVVYPKTIYSVLKKKEIHFSLGKRRRFIFVTIEGLRLTKAEYDVVLFVFQCTSLLSNVQ